jgi:type 1 glutamine amidotransferase
MLLSAMIWPLLVSACLAASQDRNRTYVVSPVTARAIENAAPDSPLVKPSKPRRVLVYGRVPTHPESVACCFKAMEALGRKSGAFETVSSGDPAMFLPENLRRIDAVVNFVASGKGLVGIHGATAIRDDLKELAQMYGGQIMGHRGGLWWVRPDEPAHPLCAPLDGQSFELRDEIYVHRKPLTREPMSREGVRVLLALDLERVEDPGLRSDGDYALSWVRTFGKGRVFYSALGHSKHAYANPALMKHYLAGIQFAVGDLKADATPRP